MEHIDEHIIQLTPAKVILLIGTNDFEAGEQIEDISQQIREICGRISGELPECKIYVESVYPVNETVSPLPMGRRHNNNVIQLNEMIRTWIRDKKQVSYLDIYSFLIDEDGQLKESYIYDGLHLTVQGYEVVKSVLEQNRQLYHLDEIISERLKWRNYE